MSVLRDVYISGVRSFAPAESKEDIQHIEFSSPLTILVGQNGCGKTTVIEALKFACSGKVPDGTGSGYSFVNDPKLNGKVTTKAQIRLRLYDQTGKQHTILRAMQAESRPNSAKFTRLDTVVLVKEDGGNKDITRKAAEIDKQCEGLLGVSSCILNNVIFCHQETACWPLDEGKKVKDRFDEIFDTKGYNKAIEVVRKQMKTSAEELKIINAELGFKKEKKEEVVREKEKLRELQNTLTTIDGQIEKQNEKLAPLEGKIKKLLEVENNMASVKSSLAVKEAQKRNIQEQQALILKNIEKEFEGDDDELENNIKSFSERGTQMEQRLSVLQTKKSKIESEERKIASDITKKQVKVGELREEKKQMDQLCSERTTALESLAKKYDIDMNVEDVEAAVVTVESHIAAAKQSLARMKAEFDEEDKKNQAAVDEQYRNITKMKFDIESNRKGVKEREGKMRNIRCELQNLSLSDEQFGNMGERIKSVSDSLESLQSSNKIAEYEAAIEEKKKMMQKKKEELEELEKVYKILQQNMIVESDIQTQKNEIHRYESDMLKLKAKNHDNFELLFADNLPSNGLQNSVKSILKIQQAAVDSLTSELQRKENGLTMIKAQLMAEEEKLQNATNEMDTARKGIIELCGSTPYAEMLKLAEEEVDKQQKKKGQLKAAQVIYENFIKDFEKIDACCPLCKTDFSKRKQESQQIVTQIKASIHSIPNQLLKTEAALQEKQDLYNKLMQKKGDNNKIKVLSEKTIPKHVETVKNLEAKKNKLTDDINELKQRITVPKQKLEACKAVESDAAIIDQCQMGVIRCKAQITSLEPRLAKVSSDRNIHQTEVDMEDLKVDIESAQKSCEALQKKRDSLKTQINELMEQKNKLVQQQLHLEKSVQMKPQYEQQLEELTEEVEKLNNRLVDLQCCLAPLEIELKEARAVKEASKKKNDSVYEQKCKELNELAGQLGYIKKLQSKIKVYMSKDIGQLDDVLEQLTEAEKQHISCKEALEKIVKAVADINLQMSQQDIAFKSLKANVELRTKRKEEEKISMDIEMIKEKIGDLDLKNVFDEKSKLITEINSCRNAISKAKGQKEQLQVQISELEAELARPEKANADELYMNKFYEHKVMQLAIKDLDKYGQVLEKALLEYHRNCMKSINRSLRQLWRTVYRGHDIDYIQIKAEDTGGSKNRRSYNYKVVQIKNGIEMDFRGRCSAGQKILACLLIRMALAERFSTNCGILTLDEPTTNLDRENVSSLSRALAELVSERQENKHFQLIVITHDEEFLQELKDIESVEHYWQVSRNQAGNSVIEKIEV